MNSKNMLNAIVDKGQNARRHRNSLLSINSSIMIQRNQNSQDEQLPECLLVGLPNGHKAALNNGKSKDMRRCSLLSIGQLKHTLDLKDRNKSIFQQLKQPQLDD